MNKILENTQERPKEASIDDIKSLVEQMESRPENKRPNPVDFRGLLSDIDIERDQNSVAKKNQKIEDDEKKLSDSQRETNIRSKFLEEFVPLAIRHYGWIGQENKVRIVRTSMYDDYFNGVDSFMQLLPTKIIDSAGDLKCLGFSVDFTTGEIRSGEKVELLAKKIYKGEKLMIKYFSTEIMTKKGPEVVKHLGFPLPNIIISCPSKIVIPVEKDFLDFANNPDNNELKGKIENSVLKYHFLRESLFQLEFFAELSEEFEKTDVALLYKNSLETFKKIIKEQDIDINFLNKKLHGISGLSTGVQSDMIPQYARLIKSKVKEERENAKEKRDRY